jgi:carboxymethylenebutenolidase
MLIKESFADVQTSANGKESTMSMPCFMNFKMRLKRLTCHSGIFLFHPTISGYPNA